LVRSRQGKRRTQIEVFLWGGRGGKRLEKKNGAKIVGGKKTSPKRKPVCSGRERHQREAACQRGGAVESGSETAIRGVWVGEKTLAKDLQENISKLLDVIARGKNFSKTQGEKQGKDNNGRWSMKRRKKES